MTRCLCIYSVLSGGISITLSINIFHVKPGVHCWIKVQSNKVRPTVMEISWHWCGQKHPRWKQTARANLNNSKVWLPKRWRLAFDSATSHTNSCTSLVHAWRPLFVQGVNVQWSIAIFYTKILGLEEFGAVVNSVFVTNKHCTDRVRAAANTVSRARPTQSPVVRPTNTATAIPIISTTVTLVLQFGDKIYRTLYLGPR